MEKRVQSSCKDAFVDHFDRIVRNLTALAKKYEHTSKFKAIAYRKALRALPPGPIYGVESVATLSKGSIQEKVLTIIRTGEDLEEVHELASDTTFVAIDDLVKIHGIGPAKAKELVEKHRIRSVSDLIARQSEVKLNNIQRTGLRYYNDISTRIPYEEMVRHENRLSELIGDICEFNVVGSYRRKAKSSGDIDVLITGSSNNLKDVVKRLLDQSYVVSDGVLASGVVKFMGICKLDTVHRRIDILYTEPHEHPFAVLYFTGNDRFNVNMRTHVSVRGMVLNEQGLFDRDNKARVQHVFDTEHDIFDYLGYSYVEPEYRNEAVAFQ